MIALVEEAYCWSAEARSKECSRSLSAIGKALCLSTAQRPEFQALPALLRLGQRFQKASAAWGCSAFQTVVAQRQPYAPCYWPLARCRRWQAESAMAEQYLSVSSIAVSRPKALLIADAHYSSMGCHDCICTLTRLPRPQSKRISVVHISLCTYNVGLKGCRPAVTRTLEIGGPMLRHSCKDWQQLIVQAHDRLIQ